MENLLFLYFTNRNADNIHWVMVNDAGVTHSEHPSFLSECPHPAPPTKIIVLFPTEEILLTTTKLPPTKRGHQAAAALYSLEDKLAEDVLDLHAIILQEQSPELFSVGIIRKALLEDWLAKLHGAHFTPQYLLPDIFALPYQEAHWTSLFFDDRALVRTHLSQGFATHKNHYDILLKKQEHPEIISLKEATLETLCKNVQQNLPSLQAYNLLQGSYKQKTHWQEIKKRWQFPFILGITWIVLLIGFFIINSITLSSESAKLDKQIRTLYYQAYPNATSVISPELRIGQELAQLKSSTSHQQSLVLIAKAGSLLKKMPEISLQSLNFRDGVLRLNAQTSDFQHLEHLMVALQQEKLQAKQSDAQRTGNKVTATIVIELEGGSS